MRFSSRCTLALAVAATTLMAQAPGASAATYSGTSRVSVSTTNDQFTDRTALLDMAGGGRYVGFFAYDSNAVFVRDTSAGRTERIDVDSNEQAGSADLYSWGASLSGNGRYVAFESDAHLAPGDGDRRDVFLRDRVAGTTSVVSVDSNEQPLVSEEGPHASNETPVISGNGRYVAFASGYCPAVEGGWTARCILNVRDTLLGETRRLLRVPESVTPLAYSADGRYLLLSTPGALSVADTDRVSDLYRYDTTTQQTALVSVGRGGAQLTDDITAGSMSSNAARVVFSTTQRAGAGDANAHSDTYVRDIAAATTTLVSRPRTAGVQSNGASRVGDISPDGGFVSFSSHATNLVTGDTNGFEDVFVRDLASGTTVRVSTTSTGAQANGGSGHSQLSSLGQAVVFESGAKNLLVGDSNQRTDVFLRN